MNDLVSIGIPTYQRKGLLKRCLSSIRQQTYPNLEIIVSDNCSSDEGVAEVVREAKDQDPRIKFYRQDENRGARANFAFVLSRASGKFFMWAADDDVWEPWYVERCLAILRMNSHIVAATTEAQYTVDKQLAPFFREGEAFYQYVERTPLDHALHMVRHCYGNIIYSLYRIEALKLPDGSSVEALWGESGNEIPFLLYVCCLGGYHVDPEIGLYKETNWDTYAQARWEFQGGKLPDKSRVRSIEQGRNLLRYHRLVLSETEQSLSFFPIDEAQKRVLRKALRNSLYVHWLKLCLGRKRTNLRTSQAAAIQ